MLNVTCVTTFHEPGLKQYGQRFIDCNNCYIRSEKRLTVGLGIKNLAVIETVDAVLVADINELQKVKELVSELDLEDIASFREARPVLRDSKKKQ